MGAKGGTSVASWSLKPQGNDPPAAHPGLDGGWRTGGPQGRPAIQRLTPALRFGGRAAVGFRVAGL